MYGFGRSVFCYIFIYTQKEAKAGIKPRAMWQITFFQGENL